MESFSPQSRETICKFCQDQNDDEVVLVSVNTIVTLEEVGTNDVWYVITTATVHSPALTNVYNLLKQCPAQQKKLDMQG